MPTQISPSNMTGYSSPAPYVVSGSGSYSTTDQEWTLFDGSIGANTFWTSASTATGYVQIDLGASASYILGSYDVKIDSTGSDLTRAPKDWTLQGSDDGSTWDIVDTVTGETGWSDSEVRSFSCDTTTTEYRYFKINITANNGGAYLQFAELILYEQSVGAVTFNPSDKSANGILSNGNLTLTSDDSGSWAARSSRATESKSSGKWYWEATTGGSYNWIGACKSTDGLDSEPKDWVDGYSYKASGDKGNDGTASSYGDSFTGGDIIGIALDLDNGKIWFSKNGVWQASGDPAAGTGEAFSGLSGVYFAASSDGYGANGTTIIMAPGDLTYSAPIGFSTYEAAAAPEDPAAIFLMPRVINAFNPFPILGGV